MTRPIPRGTHHRSCSCGWSGTYATAAKADYSKRQHSCARWIALAKKKAHGESLAAAVDRTPKPCLHKVANHVHGTYACYTLDKCRCAPCAADARSYEQNRVRQHAYGRWDNYIDAEPARAYVRRLMDAGMGLKRVSAAADVSTGVLWKLLYGRPKSDGSRTPSKRVSKAVHARLIAVELDLADGAVIPNTDTARRLQALVANGWSMSKLGRRLGVEPGNFNPVVNATRTQVAVATAKAVYQLYVDLADQAPPEATRGDKVAASRARNLARARGWTPPLRMNGRLVLGTVLPLPDEDGHDQATEYLTDDYDEAAVLRRLGGDHTARLTKVDRIEVVRRARAMGWSLNDIADRAGIGKPERYLTHDEEVKARQLADAATRRNSVPAFTVREWAAKYGHPYPKRGRVPDSLIDLYLDANPPAHRSHR